MQTAESEDWRPGFAKRAENFSEVCAQAEGWRWSRARPSPGSPAPC